MTTGREWKARFVRVGLSITDVGVILFPDEPTRHRAGQRLSNQLRDGTLEESQARIARRIIAEAREREVAKVDGPTG